MRHRAPRRLINLLHPPRLGQARPRLARLIGRPSLRLAGGLAVMLLLATGAVVTAETLREGGGAAAYDRPTSEGRLPSGPRASRAHERAPLPTTPPAGTTAGATEDGSRAPAGTPSSAPPRPPGTVRDPTSPLPSLPPTHLPVSGAPSPLAPSLDVPSDTASPTAEPSSPSPSPSDDGTDDGARTGEDGTGDGGRTGEDSTEGDGGPGGGDGTAQPRPRDGDPPETTLVSGPPLAHVASFVFESDEGGTFECSLDGQAFQGCESPQLYTDLDSGRHVFKVRAVDRAGNADPTPAVRRWRSSAVTGGGGSTLDQGSSLLG